MKKRILLLSAFFRPLRSGAEACAEEIARQLVSRYSITIITARMRRSFPQEEMMGDVKIVRVGTGTFLDKWLYPWIASRAACAMEPDLIHAILESFAGEALVRCAKECPAIPRLLTCQSTNTTLRLKEMHRAAHRVTAISAILVERAKKLGKREALLIRNGIDLHAIEYARKHHQKVPGRVLFLGRLEPMKGVDTLLEAFSSVVGRQKLALSLSNGSVERAHLRIVGDGSRRRELEALARKLGIADRVTFVGYLHEPAVYKEYAEAEVFCGLSRSEALGNVFLEAQAAGCAVLTTKVGGIPEIVKDGETGLLVKPDHPKAAADALVQLLDDAQLRAHLAKAAIQNVRSYDWQSIAEQYAGVYEEMMK